jgi:hypothetical protein
VVAKDPAHSVCRDSSWGQSVFALTYHEGSTLTVESTLVRMRNGAWEDDGACANWPLDNAVDTDNGPSAAATKQWMTKQQILPLRIAPGSQPSSNPFYTHSVYIQKDQEAIQKYIVEQIVYLSPSCITQLVSDYF